MNDALFVGTYPGLTAEMLEYAVGVIRDFSTQLSGFSPQL